MVYLGLDVGDRRIGIAVSTGGILAGGVETFVRRTLAADTEYLSAMAEKYKADVIVSGLPKHLNGSEHEQAAKNEILLEELRKRGHKIDYWDERFSSKAAEMTMLEADLSRKKRKENIDKLAAVIILQNYLDFHNRGGNHG